MNERKLVVIDDDPEIRDAMSRILAGYNYEVFTAEDGPKGLELVAGENPSLVLTDIMMPGMDGIEVLRRVKEQSPDVEVIVITGHGEMDMAVQALQLEASDFINKPISKQSLTVALRRAEQRIWLRNKLREHTEVLEQTVKERTDELVNHHEFERNLIQASIDGIIANDRKGKIIIFNEGAERIYGYTPEEILGRDVTELYPESMAKQVKKMLYGPEYGGPGRLINYEVEVLVKGGERVPVLLSAIMVHKKGEEIATVGYFKDMREIKQMEREIVESERIAAMGLAVKGVAHTVKNILHRMKLGAFMVDEGLEKEEFHLLHKGWEMVRKNIDQISRMTMEMLNYASTGPSAAETCSLNSIVDEVCELMEGKALERGIELVRVLDSSLPEVTADTAGIHTCLLNLVTNAIEAFPESGGAGQIVVSTGREAEAGVSFEVKDTGRGMSKELQKQIFKQLVSTKGAQGTGLGLATVHKIVCEHGGRIQLESEPNKGSCFTIVLPIDRSILS
ncbi:MAG: response regulator [Deltaproteobacteria bacterium]|jgi:two-component system NtrC family sensor kinase